LVNPNFNRSIDGNFLRNELKKAKISPDRERSSPSWPASTSTSRSAWPAGRSLARRRLLGAAEDETLTLETLIERCEVVVVGIDGGGLDDLLGLPSSAATPRPAPGSPGPTPGPSPTCSSCGRRTRQKLQDFVAAGELTLCTTPTQDVDEIVALVGQVKASGKLPRRPASASTRWASR
jgi:phage terminase large subunit-like protein